MKRILAIVASRLACELARQKLQGKKAEAGKRAKPAPLAVILEREGGGAPVLETATIDVIDDEARRLGVRVGQTVTSATALASHLEIHRITYGEIDAALGRIAEVAMAFGPTAALRLRESPEDAHRTPWGDAPFDTVWLDITGAAHLAGGEEELLDELAERVGALGHSVRLAIAGGPRLAQSLARHSPGLAGAPGSRVSRHPIAAPNGGKQAMAPLPVQALPIDPDTASWLMRLGVITVGDLARLPRPAALARLGARGVEALDLAAGRDDIPLLPYAAPRIIEESIAFENGVETAAELLFVLRGMTSRAAARLGARGEAAARIEVTLPLDRSIAALRLADRGEDVSPDEGEIALGFHVDLPAPLAEEADLLRALRAKLERTELFAPAIGIRMVVPQIVSARRVQLDLGRGKALDPDKLPALLAELSADIGADRIGVLSIQDAHRPEGRSKLRPANVTSRTLRRDAQMAFPGTWSAPPPLDPALEPARMLPAPVPLGWIGKSSVIAVDQQLFAIDKLEFVMRLDKAEWWAHSPASRDYVRAWLSSGDELQRVERLTSVEIAPAGGRNGKVGGASGEALIYVDRNTREAFLQGWCE
jgi:protein ImuB